MAYIEKPYSAMIFTLITIFPFAIFCDSISSTTILAIFAGWYGAFLALEWSVFSHKKMSDFKKDPLYYFGCSGLNGFLSLVISTLILHFFPFGEEQKNSILPMPVYMVTVSLTGMWYQSIYFLERHLALIASLTQEGILDEAEAFNMRKAAVVAYTERKFRHSLPKDDNSPPHVM